MAEDAGRHFVKFTRAAGERIGRAVVGFERMPVQSAPLRFERVGTPAVGSLFRIGTFTGVWAVDTFRVVTFFGTTATVTAMNLWGEVGATGSTTTCAIARDGTAWHVIQARCP